MTANRTPTRTSAPPRSDLRRLPVSEHRFVQSIDKEIGRMHGLSDGEVRSIADGVREDFSSLQSDEISVARGFALASEAVRRVLGFQLYSVQLYASKILAAGSIAEMATGEGKTLSAVPATVVRGLYGAGVHIATPNAYLAERDHELLAPIYELLGLTTALLPEKASPDEKKVAYQADVTFGTGYEFGFDYLRDQLALRTSAMSQLGSNLIAQLTGNAQSASTAQRGLAFSIVDEADNVLIDDASSPLILSQIPPGEAADGDAIRLAMRLAEELDADSEYTVKTGRVELSKNGKDRIHRDDVAIPVKQLLRPWASYVEQALHAKLNVLRDVHYVLDGEEVQLVDATTGRIFADRSWQNGLHQAVEAKEGLKISPESQILAEITRQRFYRLYGQLAGMTGTADNCERELAMVYGTKVVPVPLRQPSRRKTLPMRILPTHGEKYEAILRAVVEMHSTGRPILIGTRTIESSQEIVEGIESLGLPCQLLNGKQDAEEASVVSAAGQSGAITIATNLAGRGTDIKLDERARHLGGLHVIVAECHDSGRIDRQLVGRCARQGDPGSTQTFVSADDSLLEQNGEWLADTIRKLSSSRSDVLLELERKVRGVQLVAERRQAAAREAMLQADLSRESMLAG